MKKYTLTVTASNEGIHVNRENEGFHDFTLIGVLEHVLSELKKGSLELERFNEDKEGDSK